MLSVSLRVAANTLEEVHAKALLATDAFFGETPYTAEVVYVQATLSDYDEDGLPVRYEADVQCSTAE